MDATVIGVMGASGGLGTTTAAAHIAWCAAAAETVLLDADPSRGAVDVQVGVEHLPGPRWNDFSRLRGTTDGPAVAAALPRTSRYAVLAAGPAPPRGAVSESVVMSVVDGLARHTDLLVMDLGSDLPHRVPLLARCHLLVVVTGLGVRRLADLDRLTFDLTSADEVSDGGVPAAHLLTRGARRHVDLGEQVATHANLPLLGHWPDDQRVAADLERGIPPGERTHGLDTITRTIVDLATSSHRELGVSA